MTIRKTEESEKSLVARALASLRAVNLFSSSCFFHFFTVIGDKFSLLFSLLFEHQSLIWIMIGTAFLTYLLLRYYLFL